MKLQKCIFISICTLTFLLFQGCGGTAKIATFTFDEYQLTDKAKNTQTISNVTIDIIPISPSQLYEFPELFSFSDTQLPEALKGLNLGAYYPSDINGKRWCWTLGTGRNILSAFKVKISNKTPHILRMKDARIYLVAEGSDPIAAATDIGNTQLYNVGKDGKEVWRPNDFINGRQESLVYWVTYFEEQYERERPKSMLSFTYPIGLASQVMQQNLASYKLINDVSREILPDFSYEGILLFPFLVSKPSVKLMFYDITTKTDAAGNPIEKAKFEFPLKIETVNMWYDSINKKWIVGTPPVAAK